MIVHGIALLFSLLNHVGVLAARLKQPPDTMFIGITHWYEDYFLYVSQLTQGAGGAWLTHQPFTTEVIPPTIFWWYNLLLGKISALTGLFPWVVYEASVFFLSWGYILLAHRILTALFPQEKLMRVGALVIALTSTNLFTLSWSNQRLFITPITYFYAYTQAFNRIGGVSHLILQNILSLSLVLLYATWVDFVRNEKEQLKHLFAWSMLWICLIILLSLINPVYVAVDLMVFSLVGLWYVRRARWKQRVHMLLPLVASALVVVAPITLIQYKALTHPFYESLRAWEARTEPASIVTFILSTGLLTVPALVGLPVFLRKTSPLGVAGILFTFFPMILYFSPLPRMFSLPVFRLLQPPAYVFLGAFAIEGMRAFITKLFTFRYRLMGMVILLIVYLFFQIPILYSELYGKMNQYYLYSSTNYLEKNIYEGLLFLKAQPKSKNVLATGNLEFIVPAVSGLSVYSAHRTSTWHYDQKAAEVFTFYSGKMNPEAAFRFLIDRTIGYVLWKFSEGPDRIKEYYPFLRLIYQNSALAIYTP